MDWATTASESSGSNLSSSNRLEQPSSLCFGFTGNRSNADEIWQEVAKRYKEIIEKDIRLRNSSQTMASFTLQTEQQTNSTINPSAHCPKAPAKPVDYEEEFHHSVLMKQNEKKDTGTFPKIVKVFSLKPSLPMQIFRDHVTIVISPREATAQTLVGKSGENEPCKRTEKEKKVKGGEIPSSHDKKSLPDFQCTGISRRNSSRGTSFLMNQHICGTEDIDTMQLGEKEVQSACLSGRTFAEEWFQIPHDFTSEQKLFSKSKGVYEPEVMVNGRKQNVSERELSDVEAHKKKKRRKRKAIFQQTKTTRSKKRCFVDDIKNLDQTLIREELISDTVNQTYSHFQYYGSFRDKETKMNETTIETKERSNASEKDTQESFQDFHDYSLAVCNEETVPGETEVISKESAGSNKGSGSFPLATISSFPGTDIHQNKILRLKEKLAKQEQELQNLKRKKDSEVVLTEWAEKERFESKDLCLSKDTEIWADGNDIEEAVYLSEIDDLKHTFQKVIKSFSRTLDGKLYSTRIVPYYAHLPTGGDYKRFSNDIINQLVPKDFASQEEFLFQLGLLRIF
ncbi:uncharacterized protein LOC111334907 [Stylophora pistillata]|uniref:uncharacterized protein LOC111334907 n=1 Tax=Stylophora pistillata TaxID=50429 RepID=UPI000C046807|nr:uncharacterized protein LOC111334907 [Stylophora pistillata]